MKDRFRLFARAVSNFAKSRFLLLLVGSALSSAGCASKALPLETTYFLRPELLTHIDGIPFQKAWQRESVDWNRYTQVYVPPVNIEPLYRMEWLAGMDSEKKFRDLEDLALSTRRTLEDAFRQDPRHRFRVVDSPGPDTLVYEFALVEVVPNQAFLDTLSYLGGPLSGGTGFVIGSAWRTHSRSTVAFEVRVLDGGTQGALAMYADREAEKNSLINVKSLSWYGHAKGIIREWARQLVQVTERAPGEQVKDSKTFEMKPW